MANETPKNEHNHLENEKIGSKKIYAIFIIIGGVLMALVLSLSLISFGGGDSENTKSESEANKLFALLSGESGDDKEAFGELESNPDAEFSEANGIDGDTQKLLDSVGKESYSNQNPNDYGDCLDCQTQKKLKQQLKQCVEQCGDDANCKLKCVETYQQALDDYANLNNPLSKKMAELKEKLQSCLATCNGDKECEQKCQREYEKALAELQKFNSLSSKEKALAQLKEKLENCLMTCNGDKDCEQKCIKEYEAAVAELERMSEFGELSDDLISSVANGQNFQGQLGQNGATLGTLGTLGKANDSTDSKEQEQPWWLSKDGFVKPRIIKGTSAGLITAKPSENAEKDKQKPLTQEEMEQKTLQALNKMIDNAQNVDYKAIMAANMEMMEAMNPIDKAAMGMNSDTAYRQQSEFKGDTFLPSAATFSTFNQSLLMPKGTYIPCSLQTRIVSELKGQIGCIVATDIYSANGQTLLIEKGSFINGSYTNADVNDGTTRLYVVWSEIRTPHNVIIPVESGASDPLGGSGIAGDRDNHYLERFGAAILLSVIDGTIKSLGQFVNAQIAPNTQMFNPQQANQLANTALRQTINIKPTIYRNHGDLVGVYVNKDIDFSRVYQLQLRRKQQ